MLSSDACTRILGWMARRITRVKSAMNISLNTTAFKAVSIGDVAYGDSRLESSWMMATVGTSRSKTVSPTFWNGRTPFPSGSNWITVELMGCSRYGIRALSSTSSHDI